MIEDVRRFRDAANMWKNEFYLTLGNSLCEAVKAKLVSADREAGIREEADEVAEAKDAVYLTKSNAAYTRKKLLPMVREAVAEALKLRQLK